MTTRSISSRTDFLLWSTCLVWHLQSFHDIFRVFRSRWPAWRVQRLKATQYQLFFEGSVVSDRILPVLRSIRTISWCADCVEHGNLVRRLYLGRRMYSSRQRRCCQYLPSLLSNVPNQHFVFQSFQTDCLSQGQRWAQALRKADSFRRPCEAVNKRCRVCLPISLKLVDLFEHSSWLRDAEITGHTERQMHPLRRYLHYQRGVRMFYH